jgi:hypothetical protein
VKELRKNLKVGNKTYEVVVQEQDPPFVAIWFYDVTGERFTRFTVTVEARKLKAKLRSLKALLEFENGVCKSSDHE